MNSSDNLVAPSADPWMFGSAFENSWVSEAFARDTEILTKALQHSIANTTNNSEFFKLPETPSSQHQTQSFSSSGGGGSETETVSKRTTFRTGLIPVKGKVTKRKSRASKRSPTTFITADPENFRQMVQQVTGIRFSGGPGPVGSLLKPEPQRPVGGGSGVVNRLQTGCLLPTLDTSAFLLDHHQQQQVVGPGSVEFGPPAVLAEACGPGFDFDGFAGFPTLESWN